MFDVTPAARERLSEKLVSKKAAEDQALRFTRKPRGWKLCLDRLRPADTAIIHQDRVVLLLDEVATQAMSRITLDVRNTGAGPRLTLR